MTINIDGTEITDVTIDGTNVQEITIDGSVAWQRWFTGVVADYEDQSITPKASTWSLDVDDQASIASTPSIDSYSCEVEATSTSDTANSGTYEISPDSTTRNPLKFNVYVDSNGTSAPFVDMPNCLSARVDKASNPGDIEHYNGSSLVTIATMSLDTWETWKVDPLSDDTFDFYLNGTFEGNYSADTTSDWSSFKITSRSQVDSVNEYIYVDDIITP